MILNNCFVNLLVLLTSFIGVIASITKANLMPSKLLRLKVVVLHGKDSCSSLYRTKLNPLLEFTKNYDIEWIFPEAPYYASNENCPQKLSWWNLPAGVRSFNALEYGGVEKSLSIVESLYPFDILIGHSQGAMLSSVILARGLIGSSNITPKGAILSGAAWPNPFASLLESLPRKSALLKNQNLRILHTTCFNDPVNPYEMAVKTAHCFDAVKSNKIIEHNNGHNLPLDKDNLQEFSILFQTILQE